MKSIQKLYLATLIASLSVVVMVVVFLI